MNFSRLALPLISALFVCTACSSSGGTDEPDDSLPYRLVQITLTLSNGDTAVITTQYTASGNIGGRIFQENGETTLETTFETLANGQFVRRSEDNNQDGMEDFSSTYIYDTDNGLRRINRIGSSGLIEQIEIFEFSDALAVSRDSRDIVDVEPSDLVDEASGTLNFRRVYNYENRRLTSTDIDTNGDGEMDRQEAFSYLPDGRLATSVVSSLTEGVITSSDFLYERGACNNNFGNSASDYFCISVD